MQDPIKSLLKHNLASGVFMDCLRASAAGWDTANRFDATGDASASARLYDPFYFYVCHLQNDWAMLTQCFCAEALAMANAIKGDPSSYGMVRDSLGYAITEASAGRPLRHAEYSTEEIVGILACMYAGTTQTYAANAKAFGPGAHFVIIGYPSQTRGGKPDLLLRPFAVPPIPGQPGPLPVRTLLANVERVATIDRVNHPEWFR